MHISNTLIFLLIFVFSSCSSEPNKINEKEVKSNLFFEHGTDSLMKKNYTEALSALLKADELWPDQTKVLNNLAMAYYLRGARAEAIKYLKKSLDVDPKNSDARNNLASMYYEQGDLLKAENEYQNVLKDLVYPNQFRTYYNLGLIKLRQGKLVEARQYFESSLKENSNYCPAHFELGRQEFIFGQFKKALKKFNDAIHGTCYNEPASHYYLGLTYLELKDYKKAQEKFNEIMAKFPNDELSKKSITQLKRMEKSIPISELNEGDKHKEEMDVLTEKKAATKKEDRDLGQSPEF